MPINRSRVRVWLRRLALLVVLMLVVVAGALAYAWAMPDFTPGSHPHPLTTYAAAAARIADERKADPEGVAYHEIFYGQGSRTETSVVLFHGFTSAPRQMDVLARAYAAQGYNVYVPRMPHHGFGDRMTGDLMWENRHELIRWTDDAIDIGAGLGKHVVVSGLSAGGTLSAWAAKNRTEVSEAVLVAPLFQPKILPWWAIKPIYQLTPVLPPIWVWWNPAKREEQKAPVMAYPRYTLRSLGDFLAIGASIEHGRPQRSGQIARVVVIENDDDIAVDNDVSNRILDDHLRPLTNEWVTYHIPAALHWKHDLIDPLGENVGNAGAIYQRILPMYGLPATATASVGASVSATQ